MPVQTWLKLANALLALSLLHGVQAQNCSTPQSLTGFPPCDALIAAGLSYAVCMPSSPRFANLLHGSWALNTRKAPWCYVLPSSAANDTQIQAASRNAGSYLTLANDSKIMRFCVEQHAALVEVLKAALGPDAFSTAMEFQAIPIFVSDISISKGGNMLGLERSPRNKILFVFGIILSDSSKSAQQYPWVNQQVNAVVQRIDAHAKAIGSSEEFVYLNYAHAPQDPIGSYGKANVTFIRSVADKYDPEGFFQERLPGGFKISRV